MISNPHICDFKYPKLFVGIIPDYSYNKKKCEDVFFACRPLIILDKPEIDDFLSNNRNQQCCEIINKCLSSIKYDLDIDDVVNSKLRKRYKNFKFSLSKTEYYLNVNQWFFPIKEQVSSKTLLDVIHHIYYWHRKYINMKEFININDVLNNIFEHMVFDFSIIGV